MGGTGRAEQGPASLLKPLGERAGGLGQPDPAQALCWWIQQQHQGQGRKRSAGNRKSIAPRLTKSFSRWCLSSASFSISWACWSLASTSCCCRSLCLNTLSMCYQGHRHQSLTCPDSNPRTQRPLLPSSSRKMLHGAAQMHQSCPTPGLPP